MMNHDLQKQKKSLISSQTADKGLAFELDL